MAEPFLGQIRIFTVSDAPENWAKCDGTSVSISQHYFLYRQIGTTYGGDADNFNLPDLRGRVPLFAGTLKLGNYPEQTIALGQQGGSETKTLEIEDMQPHTHLVQVTSQSASSNNPKQGALGPLTERLIYGSEATNMVEMDSQAIGYTCAGQPVENMQVSLVLNFCIALTGQSPNSGQ